MTETLSMMEARAKLTGLPEEFERSPETGAVTVTAEGPYGLGHPVQTFSETSN